MILIIKRLLVVVFFILALIQSSQALVTVTTGSTAEPVTMDPAQVWDDTSSFYIANIFNTLVKLNPKTMVIEPCLAESWEPRDGGKSWIFKLRKDVFFHDGTPCDADAVVFSFKRQLDPKHPHRYYDFPMFADTFTYLRDVKKVDPLTVLFQLAEPFAPFLTTLTVDGAAIVSPQAVMTHKKNFPWNPVGTGPFKLKKWIRGKRVVLEAHPKYWEGKPAIDEYVDLIENNHDILLSNFREGKVDILQSYSISKMVAMKKLSWVKILRTPIFSVGFIAFNLERPLLKRRGVRQALCYSWDERALKLVMQDYEIPIHSLLPKGMMGYDERENRNRFSLGKARDSLQKEVMAGSLNLVFLLRNDGSLLHKVISMYAMNLKKLGINLQITRVAPQEYDRRIIAGDYDLTYSSWIVDYPDPDSIFFPFFSKSLQKQGFANLSGVKDAEPFRWLDQARREINTKNREEIYKKVNQRINQECWAIPVSQDLKVIIYNKRIGDIAENPMGKIFLFDLKAR